VNFSAACCPRFALSFFFDMARMLIGILDSVQHDGEMSAFRRYGCR
jgi:hypothetical protein